MLLNCPLPIIKNIIIKIVNYKSLIEFADTIDNDFIICAAVYIDDTRLIDNIYH